MPMYMLIICANYMFTKNFVTWWQYTEYLPSCKIDEDEKSLVYTKLQNADENLFPNRTTLLP
jgi:hypothetical protein